MPGLPLLDVLLDFGVPVLVLAMARRMAWVRVLGPPTLCYLGGMVHANLPFASPDQATNEVVAWGAVGLSIPLLLFSVDVVAWTRLARTAVLAFVLCCSVVVICTLAAGTAFAGRMPWTPELAGMLTGVYIGGTPNMAALAGAFGTPPEVFVNCNASDLVFSAIYLLFMLSLGPRVLGTFLRPWPGRRDEDGPAAWQADRPATLAQRGAGLALAAACTAAGGAAYALVPSSFAMALSILVITTLAVVASLAPAVRRLPGTYTTGQFLLLAFCFAVGAMADLGRLVSTGPHFLLFTGVVIASIAVLQFAVMALFRIDRDTAMVTSVATIMSPPFIAAVADKLRNREVLFTGIASGLMGYAVGNYLGIAVAWMLA